jgi:peptide/nickel transport system ATP-binding protein
MPLLVVENLKTYYFSPRGPVKAVDGISFNLEKGQCLGIAGESGCGKSTVTLSLMRLIKGGRIVSGKITLGGTSLLELSEREMRRLRWKKLSMVSQAAMGGLNPVYRIGDQIVEAIQTHSKMKKSEAWKSAEELLKKVDMDPRRARNYPHELSGGMRQRAMIAMALALSPDLVIADEPTTALDMVTQAQVLRLMKELQEKLDISIILISHDLSILGQTCSRIIIMYAGKIVEQGDVTDLFYHPLHPYTVALLNSFPDIKSTTRKLMGLSGTPPDLVDPPAGCRFYNRCPKAFEVCKNIEPLILEVAPQHSVACHLVKGVN